MWECGIAQGKSTAKTKIVVIQCTEDTPTVFRDKLTVKTTEDSLYSFVNQLHTRPGFFPDNNNDGVKEAFLPNIEQDVLKSRGKRLVEELLSIIPSGTTSSRHLWDFIRLRLGPQPAKQIQELIYTQMEEGITLIKKRS